MGPEVMVLALLLLLTPSGAAFSVNTARTTMRSLLPQEHQNHHQGLSSICISPLTQLRSNIRDIPDDFNVDEVINDIESALEAAWIALDAAEVRQEETKKNTPTALEKAKAEERVLEALSKEVDSALDAAKVAIDEDSGLFDSSELFFANQKEIIDLLNEPGMNAAKFEVYVVEKEEEARAIQKNIRTMESKRLKAERLQDIVAIALDGAALGAIVGALSCGWLHTIMDIQMSIEIPMLIVSGVFGCSAVVGATSGGKYTNVFRSLFGNISRTIGELAVGQGDTFRDSLQTLARQASDNLFHLPANAAKAIMSTAREALESIESASKPKELKPTQGQSFPALPLTKASQTLSRPVNAVKKSPRPVNSPTLTIKPARKWGRSGVTKVRSTEKLQKAPRGVPTLVKWRIKNDGSLAGLINGSQVYEDGTKITTTPLKEGEEAAGGLVVTTKTRSKYFLDPKTAPTKGLLGGIL